MAYKTYSKVWIDCTVRPGAFSNERLVRIKLSTGDWLGFVDENQLENPIKEGQTSVCATVLVSTPEFLMLAIPGNDLATKYIYVPAHRVRLYE